MADKRILLAIPSQSGESLSLTLQGGFRRQAGGVDPSEWIDEEEARGDFKIWSVFSLVGRFGVGTLITQLFGSSDFGVQAVCSTAGRFVFDRHGWDINEWHSALTRIGYIQVHDAPKRYIVSYEGLNNLINYSWAYEEGPFEYDYSFVNGAAEAKLTGLGPDYADAKIVITGVDPHLALSQFANWVRVFAFDCFVVRAYQPYVPHAEQRFNLDGATPLNTYLSSLNIRKG